MTSGSSFPHSGAGSLRSALRHNTLRNGKALEAYPVQLSPETSPPCHPGADWSPEKSVVCLKSHSRLGEEAS